MEVHFPLQTIFTFDSNNIVYMDRACGQIGRDDPYQVRNWVFFHFFANPGGNDQFLIHYEYVDGKNSD